MTTALYYVAATRRMMLRARVWYWGNRYRAEKRSLLYYNLTTDSAILRDRWWAWATWAAHTALVLRALAATRTSSYEEVASRILRVAAARARYKCLGALEVTKFRNSEFRIPEFREFLNSEFQHSGDDFCLIMLGNPGCKMLILNIQLVNYLVISLCLFSNSVV